MPGKIIEAFSKADIYRHTLLPECSPHWERAETRCDLRRSGLPGKVGAGPGLPSGLDRLRRAIGEPLTTCRPTRRRRLT